MAAFVPFAMPIHDQHPVSRWASLVSINSIIITGDQLIKAFAFVKGTGATRLASLERFAAQPRLKPPTARSVRMGLVGAPLDDLGID